MFGLFNRKTEAQKKQPSDGIVGDAADGKIRTSGTIALEDVFPDSSQIITHTYVSRKKAESEIAEKLRKSNSIITFSGPSKSGKTVLAGRFSGNLPIAHIHVFSKMTSEEFWESLRSAIEAPNTIEVNDSRTTVRSKGSESAIGGRVGIAGAAAGGEYRRHDDTTTEASSGQTIVLEKPGRIGVIEHLKANPHTIVVDDYHWLNPDIFDEIFPPLKQVLSLKSKIILISVSQSVFPVAGDLNDFNGRIISAKMPPWEHAEIQEIGRLGFKALNVEVDKATLISLANCAYFSPLLMQGLCNQYCYENNVTERAKERRRLPKMSKEETGHLVSRFARPITEGFDPLLQTASDKKWRTKDRDGRMISMTQTFILGISHTRPFEPIALGDVVKRVREKILHKLHLPEQLPANLAKQAQDIQKRFGGERGDRSPLYYDPLSQTITIVDPYFKLWARWVHGAELGGKLFPD